MLRTVSGQLGRTLRSRAHTSPQQWHRNYASSAGSSGSSVPLVLALTGIVGLGGYVYLQRNPALKTELKDDAKELAARSQGGLKGIKEKALAGKDGLDPESGALVKDTWIPFTLLKVEPYNYNTQIYTFGFGEDAKDKPSGGGVAHAILIKSAEGPNEVKDEKGKPVIRPYTPISPPGEKGSLRLMIKEYKDGKLTSHISGLKPGESTLLFKGPISKFQYQPNNIDRGLCLAGGSGITPMWQLIHHSLTEATGDKTKWTLLFSNVSEKDICAGEWSKLMTVLRKEWDDLARRYPERLEIKYALDSSPQGWQGENGFITADMINKVFPKGNDRVRAYVCGPPGQVKSLAGPKDGPRQGEVQGALKELGYTVEEVFKY